MKKVLGLVAIAALSVGSLDLCAMIPQGNNQGQQNLFAQPFNPIAYTQQLPMVPGTPVFMPQQPVIQGIQNQFVQPFNPMAYTQQPPVIPGMSVFMTQQPVTPGMMSYQVTTMTTYCQPLVVYPSRPSHKNLITLRSKFSSSRHRSIFALKGIFRLCDNT